MARTFVAPGPCQIPCAVDTYVVVVSMCRQAKLIDFIDQKPVPGQPLIKESEVQSSTFHENIDHVPS